MHCEIISVGDEMTSGSRLDTNSQWLSVRMEEMGIAVAFHTTVGDTLSHNTDVFRIAARRSDVIIVTGGLGPTQDDLTREALGEAMGVPLKLDEPSLAIIRSMFASRGRPMPERNNVQAMFPLGTVPIPNPRGTAPGIDATIRREDGTAARLFALPGVPAEMKQMFNQTVAPEILKSETGKRFIRQNVMKFFGIGESDMEARLGDMISRTRQPRVGITVSSATISLRITAVANSEAECQTMIEHTRREILERVSELYFGDGETTEQHHVVTLHLTRRSQTLLLIEMGYAAPLGHWFASLGPVNCLRGGLSLAKFSDLEKLVVAPETSRPSEREPADVLKRIKERFGADWLLVVDAYPSLEILEQSNDAQEVSLSVLDPSNQLHTTRDRIGGHPTIVHPRIAKSALAMLRGFLVE